MTAGHTVRVHGNGAWQGHPPTGRRFDNVDEVSIYTLQNGRITATWSLEDNLGRHLARTAANRMRGQQQFRK
ncbi:ester cyclase [Kribbella sp. NPDC002412]